ncbi:MAG: DUF4494 domain-containing protein [Prevotella sp.]|nr:DUF4494 domain-containing protein [Prevotella sp.]MDE6150428.1 DUF4494 domain-containing protein [Prevotella sp.]
MRIKQAKFFECKVRYEKTMEDGLDKKVTETYVVDALSFTEAEGCIIEDMKPYVGDKEMEVTALKIASYNEVLLSDKDSDDKYYKIRLNFITLDERNGKEKKTAVDYLVQAATVEGARKNMEEAMSGTMIDYVIVSVIETNIIDLFEHKNI